MGKKLLIAAFAVICIMSCSTDNSDNQTLTIDESIPEIANLVTFIPGSQFDDTSRGKYVGIFGHYTNPELHGKIYINAGLDTRYTALIQLVNGEELKFIGTPQQSKNNNLVYFEGETGNFDIDFTDFKKPEATNVFMNDVDTEAYIVLAKTTRGADPAVIVGSYVDSSDPTFFGNWDLIANPATATSTPFTTMIPGVPFPVSGFGVTQEIVTMSISHAGSMTPFIINGADDFDTNAAIACAPSGITIPTTEPVIIDVIIDSPLPLGDVADAISAGGQTSMINGIESTWSFNYTSEIVNPLGENIPASYISNDCNPALSGTWSWNGRTGTTTVL
ncbi:hypothetical protein [Dokdonia sp.]|uniref:hypothetical protein n=1 Tax=Dokdonia sp. TaxID=2024995 RepID=UPI003266E8AD